MYGLHSRYVRRLSLIVGLLPLLLQLRITQPPRSGLVSLLVSATEVKWTPNEEDTKSQHGGPLPLSMKQRQQLLQLEQVIRSSPNPDETLRQAAEANKMTSIDLKSLLDRNRHDLEASGQISSLQQNQRLGGSSPVNLLWSLVSAGSVGIFQLASRHPRYSAIFVTMLLVVIYAAIQTPQTGLILSSTKAGWSSRGPTTMWAPPVPYVRKCLVSDPSIVMGKVSPSVLVDDVVDFKNAVFISQVDDGFVWHKLPKSNTRLRQAASAQISIRSSDLYDDDRTKNKDGDNDDNDDGISWQEEIAQIALEQARHVMTSLDLTEFVTPAWSVRLISSGSTAQSDDGTNGNSVKSSRKKAKQQPVVLVVRQMGDWGRYGLLPMQVTDFSSESEYLSTNETRITLSTLEGNHFDGQIHIAVQYTEDQNMRVAVVVKVHLVVPRHGRMIRPTVAKRIVDSMCTSMQNSIVTRTRQALVRRTQSSMYQDRVKRRAVERRHERFIHQQQLEEMANDRRRRWQRQNPNAGHYRPSGDRMRSPNNAVYK